MSGYDEAAVREWWFHRDIARSALREGDGARASSYASGQFGGDRSPDTWILNALGAVTGGTPESGIRALDLGLEQWITETYHRCLLHWVRGAIRWRFLEDPAGGLADLRAAADRACPLWTADIAAAVAECEVAVARTRGRTAVPDAGPRWWPEVPPGDLPLDLRSRDYPRLFSTVLGLPLVGEPVPAVPVVSYHGDLVTGVCLVSWQDPRGARHEVRAVHEQPTAVPFAWGPGSSVGSLHLARAVLVHHLGDPALAQRLAPGFAGAVLSTLPRRRWRLPADVVDTWVRRPPARVEDRSHRPAEVRTGA